MSWPIDPALVRQRALMARRTGLEVYRIQHGAVDAGPPGTAVDRYGNAIVAWCPEQMEPAARTTWAHALLAQLRPNCMVLKVRAKDPRRSDSIVVHGTPPEQQILREGPCPVVVRLHDGVQTGLFLDLRPVRRFITDHRPGVMGTDVLNLFAYTGTLSARAAHAGARRVTTIDASRRALAWARENMAAAGLDPDRHRWFPDDVLQFLGRQPDASYDWVLADPPATGTAGRKRFSLRNDLDRLLSELLRVTRQGGTVVFSSHDPSLYGERLSSRVLTAAGRGGRGVRLQRLRPDFDLPAGGTDWGDYLSMVVVRDKDGQKPGRQGA
jgi:23S rRNA G2069 N7-methylase RlmK/C1962 C5-methylase RlmI